MRKLLIVVGLVAALSIVSVVQADDIVLNYCSNISASDTYATIGQDILFENSSIAYNFDCFRVGGAAIIDNVTIDFNGTTLYINSTTTASGIGGRFVTNLTIKDGTIDFTNHTFPGEGIYFNWAGSANITIENMTVISAGSNGLHIAHADIESLEVELSSFTGSSTYDLDLELPQSEITSCENVWNTFRPDHSILSKDSCSDPPAEYKDYIYETNCTQHSSTAYGSLVCSNEFPIPSDCTNITTEAWTVIIPQNETWLNANSSFTRWTCNPEGDRVTYCDNLYKTCEYYNLNAYPKRRWDDYAAGQNATSFHIVTLPYGCIDNVDGGNFTMVGRLHLACKSFTESGITIDGESESCEHELLCFNSNTMEERFTDCTSILTPCTFGCVEGRCMAVATTTLPRAEDQQSMINLNPYGISSWVSMLFTPFSIITMMLVGIGAYFEQQVKSKGAIFLAVIIIGVLGFTYLGLYPAWIGILIAIACAGILSKFVLQLW